MLRNRLHPTDVVLPHVTYQDVAAALAWLTKAFGFTEHYRYGAPDGTVQGAQMSLDNAWDNAHQHATWPRQPGATRSPDQSLTVLSTMSMRIERAKSADAKIVEDLHETSMANDSTESRTSKATTGSSHGTFGT